MMKLYRRAILPLGFQANGIASGIKKSNKLDLALFYSSQTAKAACQFTTNKIQAAPIKLDKKYLKYNKFFQAIVVNSGNANCFTGRRGLKDCEEITLYLAKTLNINKESILVASTGIIGRRLPLDKIKKAIPELVKGLTQQGIDKAKRAIMTTDTFSKEITVRFNLKGQTITVCAVAKGAGMIAPNMLSHNSHQKATLLCFILTDAGITQSALNKALDIAVERSFNCITIDGCLSTNDTVILLANGSQANSLIDRGKNFNLFLKALDLACLELAKLIIRDAEGATKFIQVKVDGAKSSTEAKEVGLSVANSNLFKTAMFGENPNFGRIIASIGASGIEVEEKALKIKVSPLDKNEINVNISLNRGNSAATVYTSDLTPEYIKINAEYN